MSFELDVDPEFDDNALLLRHTDGQRHHHHQQQHSDRHRKPRRRHVKKKKLVKKEGTLTESLLYDIKWYLRALFWCFIVALVIGAGVLAATIYYAVVYAPPAAEMVMGMSKNVDTMTVLGTGAPIKMQEAWVASKGDEVISHARSIAQRVDRILKRVEADPNLNDELFTTFGSVATKTNHMLDQVTDAEWASARASGLVILRNAAEWTSNVTAGLVRDTLVEGRAVGREVRSLIREARDKHMVDIIHDAGQAATAVGRRVATLDQVTIKLPRIDVPVESSGKTKQTPRLTDGRTSKVPAAPKVPTAPKVPMVHTGKTISQ